MRRIGKRKESAKQTELPGMPGRSPAGEKANEFLDLKDKIEKDQGDLDNLGKELIMLMHKENRSRITLGGATISVKLIERREKIQIKKEV